MDEWYNDVTAFPEAMRLFREAWGMVDPEGFVKDPEKQDKLMLEHFLYFVSAWGGDALLHRCSVRDMERYRFALLESMRNSKLAPVTAGEIRACLRGIPGDDAVLQRLAEVSAM
jgi:hypothetical protein